MPSCNTGQSLRDILNHIPSVPSVALSFSVPSVLNTCLRDCPPHWPSCVSSSAGSTACVPTTVSRVALFARLPCGATPAPWHRSSIQTTSVQAKDFRNLHGQAANHGVQRVTQHPTASQNPRRMAAGPTPPAVPDREGPPPRTCRARVHPPQRRQDHQPAPRDLSLRRSSGKHRHQAGTFRQRRPH